jgi:hypothetical protein
VPGRRFPRSLFAALTLLVSVAGPSSAQTERPPVSPPPPSDFMLGRPRSFITFDGGFLFANAGSDVYTFIREQLTIDKQAFNAPVIGGRLGVALSPRVEVAVMYEQSEASTESEYRDFVDNQRLPITQTTGLKESHVAASVRWSLLPSGRRISRFAWIPRTVTPFVGAGAGAIKYTFEQYGSFVDFQTLRVFDSTFRSEGWAPSAHAFAGADLRVWRRMYLSGEARYTWSSAALSDDFEGFDPITLAGVRVGGSLKLVF